MKLNFNEYRELAKRTDAPLGSVNEHSCHMTLGMMSEHVELVEAVRKECAVNISEELADMCWYIFNEINEIDKDGELDFITEIHMNEEFTIIRCNKDGFSEYMATLSTFYPVVGDDKSIKNDLDFISRRIGDYADLVKKRLAYGKYIDIQDRLGVLMSICATIVNIFIKYDLDYEVALYNNIEKLKERFPYKFNTEDALNRDLEKEFEKLSANIKTIIPNDKVLKDLKIDLLSKGYKFYYEEDFLEFVGNHHIVDNNGENKIVVDGNVVSKWLVN